MTSHLSSQLISEAIAGPLGGEPGQHLQVCVACRVKVESFQTDLALFGSAVRDWSESQVRASAPVRHARMKRAWFSVPRPAAAGLVFAMLLAAFLIVAFLHITPSHPTPSGQTSGGTAVVSDAALLQQVNAELSETVPGPMEPLKKLVGSAR